MTENELRELMKRYEPLAWTVVRGVLSSRSDCEEAVADLFYSLWSSGFDPTNPGAKSYIITLARRRAVDILRARHGEPPLSEDEMPEVDSGIEISDEVAERLNREIVADVIRSLDPPDAEIFTRRYYYNHRVKQIAADLGLKPGFVKSRLERAKSEIKRRLLACGINL